VEEVLVADHVVVGVLAAGLVAAEVLVDHNILVVDQVVAEAHHKKIMNNHFDQSVAVEIQT